MRAREKREKREKREEKSSSRVAQKEKKNSFSNWDEHRVSVASIPIESIRIHDCRHIEGICLGNQADDRRVRPRLGRCAAGCMKMAGDSMHHGAVTPPTAIPCPCPQPLPSSDPSRLLYSCVQSIADVGKPDRGRKTRSRGVLDADRGSCDHSHPGQQ